jgi:hypothetical protein
MVDLTAQQGKGRMIHYGGIVTSYLGSGLRLYAYSTVRSDFS